MSIHSTIIAITGNIAVFNTLVIFIIFVLVIITTVFVLPFLFPRIQLRSRGNQNINLSKGNSIKCNIFIYLFFPSIWLFSTNIFVCNIQQQIFTIYFSFCNVHWLWFGLSSEIRLNPFPCIADTHTSTAPLECFLYNWCFYTTGPPRLIDFHSIGTKS